MSNDAERWLDLALSVSDGASVDWDAAQRGAQSDEERALVQQLRALANLSTTAESLQSVAQPLDAAQPSAAVARWGPFELRERLAAGSFGEVYRARDPRLDTYVALKLIASSASGETLGHRAIEEGRPLSSVQLKHVREAAAEGTVAAAPAASAASTGSKATGTTSGTRAEVRLSTLRDDEQGVKALYEQFKAARASVGESEVKFESFKKLITQQRTRLLEEKDAVAVDFRVALQDGKVALKAKPVRID